MLLDRLLNRPDRWLPERIRDLLGRRGSAAELPVPSPGARTMRLAYLSSARDRASQTSQHGGSRRTQPLNGLVPVPLADGVDLFIAPGLPCTAGPLDLIVHLRGGSPEHFQAMRSPALIVRADAAGLSGALLNRFGKRDWLRQTQEAVLQACWQEWRWLPIIDRRILSSFGAGYAPLGAALEQDLIVAKTDAVFILDGLHYGRPGKPDKVALEPFTRFAQQAAQGRKLMVVTHTSITPKGFTSSTDSAQALIQAVKARRVKLDKHLADDWTPHQRAYKGGFYVESFPGRGPESQVAQIQQIGRLWQAYLDLAPRSAGQFLG